MGFKKSIMLKKSILFLTIILSIYQETLAINSSIKEFGKRLLKHKNVKESLLKYGKKHKDELKEMFYTEKEVLTNEKNMIENFYEKSSNSIIKKWLMKADHLT